MRDIQFRAKRIDNGHWVYSRSVISFETTDGTVKVFMGIGNSRCFASLDEAGNINSLDAKLFQVQPDTLGQFIGAQDAGGEDIYEGDIVRHNDCLYEIRYNPHLARFTGKGEKTLFAVFSFKNSRIVSNIHDMPDTIEGDF